MWFFSPNNVEGLEGFWVFAAGLTNVEVLMTVTDTETAEEQTYHTPLGTPFQPMQDTDAFLGCP